MPSSICNLPGMHLQFELEFSTSAGIPELDFDYSSTNCRGSRKPLQHAKRSHDLP